MLQRYTFGDLKPDRYSKGEWVKFSEVEPLLVSAIEENGGRVFSSEELYKMQLKSEADERLHRRMGDHLNAMAKALGLRGFDELFSCVDVHLEKVKLIVAENARLKAELEQMKSIHHD
jgi:hypothetical protein